MRKYKILEKCWFTGCSLGKPKVAPNKAYSILMIISPYVNRFSGAGRIILCFACQMGQVLKFPMEKLR